MIFEITQIAHQCSSVSVLPGMWYPTKNMTSKRGYLTSMFVADMNSVQIIGGSDDFSNLSSTETFFVSNGSFQRRTDTLAKRWQHTANCLNGRLIIIAGGRPSPQTAELYDPLLGAPNRSINMNVSRALHASAVIDDDGNSTKKLLLVGGHDGIYALDSGEVFNAQTNSFTAVSNKMTSRRYYHTATAIGKGYVLVAGGVNSASMKLDTLELYNSSSNQFVSLLSRMSVGRAFHTATYIPSIQAVLIVGGWSMAGVVQTYDLFNVSTFNFTVRNGTTLSPRAYHTATLLLDNRVLIVGGVNSTRLSSCEIYDPVLKRFTNVTNMSVARADHSATLLEKTGQVLVCGGQTITGTMLNRCELYQP